MILVQDKHKKTEMLLTEADCDNFALVSQQQFKDELDKFENIQSIHLGGWLYAYTMRCYSNKKYFQLDGENVFFAGFLVHVDQEMGIKSGKIVMTDGSCENIEFWAADVIAGQKNEKVIH